HCFCKSSSGKLGRKGTCRLCESIKFKSQIEATEKECTTCKSTKSSSEFYKNSRNKDLRSYECKSCMRSVQIKYEKSDRSKQLKKDYVNNNREKIYAQRRVTKAKFMSKKYRKNIDQSRRANRREIYMLWHVKSSAKKRKLEFNLTIDDILIPEYCPYLGIKITRAVGRGHIQSNPSVDRIDNSKGYVKGNVQVISYQANAMKHSASISDLITFAKNILKLHST
ncbi:MAG TPA: hypothetical protein VI489_03535, partial [Candidatus Brocadiaceae bacterium]